MAAGMHQPGTPARERAGAAQRALAVLHRLPSTFTYSEARATGLHHRALYGLRDAGLIESLGRGLYRRADADVVDPALAEIAARAPAATLCLTSALVQHDLSDAIPPAPHLALPRGHRFPATAGPVSWHAFAPETFDLGRETLAVDTGLQLGLYNEERTLVDVFRLRHLVGSDEAYEALRRWLRRGGAQPARLLELAGRFPGAVAPIRHALEVLL